MCFQGFKCHHALCACHPSIGTLYAYIPVEILVVFKNIYIEFILIVKNNMQQTISGVDGGGQILNSFFTAKLMGNVGFISDLFFRNKYYLVRFRTGSDPNPTKGECRDIFSLMCPSLQMYVF